MAAFCAVRAGGGTGAFVAIALGVAQGAGNASKLEAKSGSSA